MCFEAHHLIAGKLFWKIRYFASSVNNVHWNDQFWANFELEKVIFPILCKNLKVFVFLGKTSNSSKACERCLHLCRPNTISELLIQSFFIISIMNLSLSLYLISNHSSNLLIKLKPLIKVSFIWKYAENTFAWNYLPNVLEMNRLPYRNRWTTGSTQGLRGKYLGYICITVVFEACRKLSNLVTLAASIGDPFHSH